MAKIHSTALVEQGAELGTNVVVGPYCIVGSKVILHDNVELKSHITIVNSTEIGADSVVYPFSSLGASGQIYKNTSAPGRLAIGARCEIREHVTMNCGSPREDKLTKIGDDCMFMVGSHIAHDCAVGKNAIFANNATLGGHVKVGDYTFIGGLSAVHQFCMIGEHVIIGGMTGVFGHIIPYGRATGNRANLEGLNLVGLERRGFAKESIQSLQQAFQLLFHGEGVFVDRLNRVADEFSSNAEVMRIIEFIRNAGTRRPLTFPKVSELSDASAK